MVLCLPALVYITTTVLWIGLLPHRADRALGDALVVTPSVGRAQVRESREYKVVVWAHVLPSRSVLVTD